MILFRVFETCFFLSSLFFCFALCSYFRSFEKTPYQFCIFCFVLSFFSSLRQSDSSKQVFQLQGLKRKKKRVLLFCVCFFVWFGLAISEDFPLCFDLVCRLKMDGSEFKLHRGFRQKIDCSVEKGGDFWQDTGPCRSPLRIPIKFQLKCSLLE